MKKGLITFFFCFFSVVACTLLSSCKKDNKYDIKVYGTVFDANSDQAVQGYPVILLREKGFSYTEYGYVAGDDFESKVECSYVTGIDGAYELTATITEEELMEYDWFVNDIPISFSSEKTTVMLDFYVET